MSVQHGGAASLFVCSFSPDLAVQPPDLSGEDVHAIASLLKLYLRELPEPLLTFVNFTPCMEAAKSM